jgi:WD40 repeat protein
MKTMSIRPVTTLLLLFLLSACAGGNQVPISTVTIEPTLAQLPTPASITTDAGALRLWADKSATVTVNRLGKGLVSAMVLSPDGQTIAVTGSVSVSAYDFNSLEELWTAPQEPSQPPHATGYGQAVWSPDGSQLATFSEVGLTLRDAKTGEPLAIYRDEQLGRASSVTWTEDGRVAVLSEVSGTLRLLDLKTGEELFSAKTDGAPSAEDFVQSKGLIAKALSTRGIVVWDTHSQQELYPPLIVCEGYCVNSLKLSLDGTRVAVAVAAERDQLSVWDLKTGEQLFTVEAPANYAGTRFAWSPDGQYLAAAFDDGTIFVWDPAQGTQVQVLSVEKVVGLAWSSDASSLVTLSQYESLAVWDVKTGQPSRSLHEHTSWIMNLALSPDGGMVAQGAEDGEIILWEAHSGKMLRSFTDPAGWVNNLAWSPDGKEIAESGGKNVIRIWDVQTGQQARTWSVQSLTVVDLAWSPDGSILASISYEGKTTLWDASTGEELRSLPEIYGSANLSWSPQGDQLSTSYPYPSFEGEQITLWDSRTGELLLTKQGVHDIAWSPLGDMVASISDNGTGFARDDTTLVVWDPQTRDEISRFNTGTFLTHIDWSPDGKLLVVSGAVDADNALMILDAQTGAQLHLLKGHYDIASAVAWSPRGDLIASSSSDGTVIIWRIGP